MLRVILAAVLAFPAGCAEGKPASGGALPPPGAGYGANSDDDVRVLSRDDCLALRDHQIDIAVAAATKTEPDSAKHLEVEARLRAESKPRTEEWVKRCSGRRFPASLVRCFKNATTPDAFNACDVDEPDEKSAPKKDPKANEQDAGS